MLEIKIPGTENLKLKYLVCDYSGTLSVDGILVSGVIEKISQLSEFLEIHVLTSDTHGKAVEELKDADCQLQILEGEDHTGQKTDFVEKLGADSTVAFGNGRNDIGMLNRATLSIAVCLVEGCAIEVLDNSDIMVKSATDAFDLLISPNRLVATLRR